MKEMIVGKIHGCFTQSFSCIATRCLCWLLTESCGGWMSSDYNSDGEAQQNSNCRCVWDALRDTTP
jgi:hypothetical protein